MCLPQPDGDPVFCALLQKELGDSPRGVFALELADLADTQQRYLRNTAILETILTASRRQRGAHRGFLPALQRARPRVPARVTGAHGRTARRPAAAARAHRTDADATAPRRRASGTGSHHLTFEAENHSYRITTDASMAQLAEGTLHRARPAADLPARSG